MVNIIDKDGIIILEGGEFQIKIDNNRKIYIKKNDNSSFSFIGSELPVGYSSEEKKKYLYNLYLILKENNQEKNKKYND